MKAYPIAFFVFCALLQIALGSLFPTAEDGVLSEIRLARHELGLVLAESYHTRTIH
jgi:hypothetical protein